MSQEISHLGGPKNIHNPLSAPNQAADRSSQEIYEFGPFRLQPAERKLLRDGVVVALTPKVFDLLVILVRNRNHLLDKSELMRLLWADSFVEDGNLSNSIFVLRKALGNNHEYIETVPTRGYRFVGAVRQLPPTAPNTISGALEVLRWEASGNRKLGARNILLAGIAAALLLFAAVFFAPRYRRARSTPMPSLPHFVMEQRLTANPPDVPVHDAVVSPDGKYVAYADPTGLYLRQVSSGDTRSFALPRGFVATPRSWYPDGTHLLVVNPGLGSDPPSLFRLSILGGEPQEIIGDARDGFVSPDGSQIAYLPSANWGDLWIMDSTGTNARKLVSGPEPNSNGIFHDWIYRVAWSPTGQYLACIESHAFNGPNLLEPTHSLRIIGPNGERVAVVLDDARLGTPVWWAPDGRILFSYREGASTQNNYGVYSVLFDERTGKTTGPPQPITQAEGKIGGISGTSDGKHLVLWRFNATRQAFISTFDSKSHKWSEPRRLALDANQTDATAWIADSKAVLFTSNRNGNWKLFRQAIDETTPEELAGGRSLSLPRLSADGKQALYLSSSSPDEVSFPAELMSKPIAGGTPRVALQGNGITNYQCAMAPATLCIFSQVENGNTVLRAFDLEHGAGRELLTVPLLFLNWSLSSDGSKLAIFLDPHRIRFLSLATRDSHDVSVKDWTLHNGDWGANGQRVFMPSHTSTGIPVILEVDQSGKAKVVLQGRANIGFKAMIQSPDSRKALVVEEIPTDYNAWMVYDF